jgi:hypothetical protein
VLRTARVETTVEVWRRLSILFTMMLKFAAACCFGRTVLPVCEQYDVKFVALGKYFKR